MIDGLAADFILFSTGIFFVQPEGYRAPRGPNRLHLVVENEVHFFGIILMP